MNPIEHYPQTLQQQVEAMIANKKLTPYLLSKYSKPHQVNSDKSLYSYVMELKNEHFKKYQLSKIIYDPKIDVMHNALGMHTYISRVQGSKLKAKNEIRIASLFKHAPLAFLELIVVHELAHLKHKEHNKAFYNLCTHILPDYAQKEFDLRLYLIHLNKFGKLFE